MVEGRAVNEKRVYGARELLFVQPLVARLENDEAFRSWILSRTPFAAEAEGAELLNEEMLAKRSPKAGTWWRSHYQHACACAGCAGRETDLLAIFALRSGRRVALHIEVKNEHDRFAPGQAAAYPLRAKCWVNQTPKRVIHHDDAATLLFCSRTRLSSYDQDAGSFDAVITAEEMRDWIEAQPTL
jgi:hypothetical protein